MRFIVFDRSGRVVSAAQKQHEQIYPKPGWVEHDPEEIWHRMPDVIGEASTQLWQDTRVADEDLWARISHVNLPIACKGDADWPCVPIRVIDPLQGR